jgi:hypothetical protein
VPSNVPTQQKKKKVEKKMSFTEERKKRIAAEEMDSQRATSSKLPDSKLFDDEIRRDLADFGGASFGLSVTDDRPNAGMHKKHRVRNADEAPGDSEEDIFALKSRKSAAHLLGEGQGGSLKHSILLFGAWKSWRGTGG